MNSKSPGSLGHCSYDVTKVVIWPGYRSPGRALSKAEDKLVGPGKHGAVGVLSTEPRKKNLRWFRVI